MELTKARKDHKCTFCREPIPAGSMYHSIAIRPWDHQDNEGFGRWKTHQVCWAFWLDVFGPLGDWEWWEDVAEFRRELSLEIAKRVFKHVAEQNKI